MGELCRALPRQRTQPTRLMFQIFAYGSNSTRVGVHVYSSRVLGDICLCLSPQAIRVPYVGHSRTALLPIFLYRLSLLSTIDFASATAEVVVHDGRTKCFESLHRCSNIRS